MILACSFPLPSPGHAVCLIGAPSGAGGWSQVNLGNLSLVEKLVPVVKQAVLDFVAENASMINCPDSYDIDADYACSQVGADLLRCRC